MAASGGVAPASSYFTSNGSNGTIGSGRVDPTTGQLYQVPASTNPYNLGAPSAVNAGTNAGLALKALQESSGLPLLGSASGSASGVGGAGGFGAPIEMPDTSAASAAAFARAKDQTGLDTRASLTSLQNELGGDQMLGSGQEAAATKDIIEHGAGQLNEVGRQQAITDAQNARLNAQTAYQGMITQRGQDINAAQAAAARQQQVLQGLLSTINSSGILY